MNKTMPESKTNYLKTVFILIFLDIIACIVPYFLPGPKPFYLLARMIIHGGIGIWIGTIINWTFKIGELKNRGPVIGYWICFGLSIIAMGGPFILAQWIIAVIVVMKTSYTEHVPDDANADNFFQKSTKSRLRRTESKKAERDLAVVCVFACAAGICGGNFYHCRV